MKLLSLISGLSWQTKLIVIAAICLSSFVAGWQVHGWKFKASQGVSIAKQEKTRQTSIVKVDKVQEVAQKQASEVKIVYRTIREKINDQNDNRICFTSDSLKLWNDAISGENQHRSEPAGRADTTSTTENAEVVATVKEVLTNASENFQICKENSIKHHALIDAIKVYKDNMCVCSE